MKVTEAERKRRSKVARELAIAAQHLRHYQRADLARQVDEVADGIYTGQITDRPLVTATAKNRPRVSTYATKWRFSFAVVQFIRQINSSTWGAEVGSTRDRSTDRYERRKLSNPEAEVADAVAHGDQGRRIPVRGRPADGGKVFHELLFARRQAGIGLA